jgi:hypothetical protein
MRHLILLVGLTFVAGCQPTGPVMPPAPPAPSAAPRFRVQSNIEPGREPQTFAFNTRIDELRAGEWTTLTSPRLTFCSGDVASITLDDQDRKIQVDASAIAGPERTKGSVKVDITKQGHSLFSSEQQLSLATPAR